MSISTLEEAIVLKFTVAYFFLSHQHSLMITREYVTLVLVGSCFLLDYSSQSSQLQSRTKGAVMSGRGATGPKTMRVSVGEVTSIEGRTRHRRHGRSRAQRIKRGWVWNQFFVLEEYMGSEPQYVGKLHTDMDHGDSAVKYTLSGEGAGSIFTIDQITGDIHALVGLDREEKSFYTLRAQVVDTHTGLPLEPESEFIIKVQDINDNEPRFPAGPYSGSVPEMSPTGTYVTQVTATDADDPTYGNSARIVYSILHGQPYFSVDPKTGVIRTALANMDREVKAEYQVLLQAKDMGGQLGGLASTTTINITLSDVNDNPPRFAKSIFHLRVPETAPVGSAVGRIRAHDLDAGSNAEVDYTIVPGDEGNMFEMISNGQSQEGVVVLKRTLDYETKKSYIFKVEASNAQLDPRFLHLGPFKDSATVKVTVLDMEEPPVFTKPYYSMDVYEDTPPGTIIGSVTAHDLDASSSAVRYSLEWDTESDSCFDIDTVEGTISTNEYLDRETAVQHKINVVATKVNNPLLSTKVSVTVNILDVNEFPPELAVPSESFVCENSRIGQVIQTVSAVDKDLPPVGQRFFFKSPKELRNRNFTVRDFGIMSALYMSQRRNKEKETLMTSKEDIRDNVIHYDDEGGGEADTHAFDMGTLRNTHSQQAKAHSAVSKTEKNGYGDGVLLHLASRNDDVRSPDIHRQTASVIVAVNEKTPLSSCGRVTEGDAEKIREFIEHRLEESHKGYAAPPYDSLATYAYEGGGSVAGSLSSIEESWVIDSSGDFSYLGDWGQPFKTLASILDRQPPTLSKES
ncbi:cadherin-12 isoform X2 [Hippoglossus stenolepis]|uniref:cadherin-12 isoform X2 n=1 Tax=Hippoglossus stenolepis TaxID=195615 RepID=UPI00159C5272|nr:cadherin-12 isoform X2 [Hippoglossus stenolepis]